MDGVFVQAHTENELGQFVRLANSALFVYRLPTRIFPSESERKEAWIKIWNAARAAGYYGPFEFNLDDRADLKKVRSRKRGFAVLSLLEPTVPLDAALQVEVRRSSQAWTVADSFCSKRENTK